MKRVGCLLYAALMLCAGVAAHAAPAIANVHELRMPAWLVRDGVRVPLAAGTAIASGDQLITGDDARIVLHFVDGGDLRIGEDATIEFSASQVASDAPG